MPDLSICFFFARPQEKLILGFITGKIKLLDMCSHLKGLRYNLLISSDNLRVLQAIEKRYWIYILTFFLTISVLEKRLYNAIPDHVIVLQIFFP